MQCTSDFVNAFSDERRVVSVYADLQICWRQLKCNNEIMSAALRELACGTKQNRTRCCSRVRCNWVVVSLLTSTSTWVITPYTSWRAGMNPKPKKVNGKDIAAGKKLTQLPKKKQKLFPKITHVMRLWKNGRFLTNNLSNLQQVWRSGGSNETSICKRRQNPTNISAFQWPFMSPLFVQASTTHFVSTTP